MGYGLVGNANLADNTYQPTFTNMISNFGTGYLTANMPNYDGLTWEKTHSWNIGLDLSLWDNRIEFIFDAYRKDTKDLLLQTALPWYTGTHITGGTSAQWANVGSMRNEGIELTLNATVINKKNFKWKTGLTYSLNKNEITALNSETGFIDKTLNFKTWGGETVTRTAVGHSVSQYYGYRVAGRINSAADFLRDNGDGTSTVIAATPNYRVGTVVSNASASALKTSIGDLLFKDLNGDGIIDSNDRDYLGSGLPKVHLRLEQHVHLQALDALHIHVRQRGQQGVQLAAPPDGRAFAPERLRDKQVHASRQLRQVGLPRRQPWQPERMERLRGGRRRPLGDAHRQQPRQLQLARERPIRRRRRLPAHQEHRAIVLLPAQHLQESSCCRASSYRATCRTSTP